MSTQDDFLQERIARIKTLIALYEDALIAIITDGVQSYSLNTGQTTQNVTKADITKLQQQHESLLNLLVTLETRLNGGGTVNIGYVSNEVS